MPVQDSAVILAVSVMIGAMSTAAVVLVSGRLQPIEAGPRTGPHARVAAFHLITELICRDGDVALGVDVAVVNELVAGSGDLPVRIHRGIAVIPEDRNTLV